MNTNATPAKVGSNDGLGHSHRSEKMEDELGEAGNCNVCGKPVRYGERHAKCAKEKAGAFLQAPASGRAAHRVSNEKGNDPQSQRHCIALSDEQVAALTIMPDHYQGDPRTECLRPLVYGPNTELTGARLRASGWTTG